MIIIKTALGFHAPVRLSVAVHSVEKATNFGEIKSSLLADWAMGGRQIDHDFALFHPFFHGMDSYGGTFGRECASKIEVMNPPNHLTQERFP
jgi:hypothetical protein